MNDWQPARIAPKDGLKHAENYDNPLDCWGNVQGKLLRIRREPLHPGWSCGTQVNFLVHPEDAITLFDYPGVLLCEHQILTD